MTSLFRRTSLVTLDQAPVLTMDRQVQTVLLDHEQVRDNDTDTDNDLDLTSNLFPDPEDFLPSSSPTFSFPPLPPTPPELDETETITSSTMVKTAIEVLPSKLEERKKDKEIKSALKNKDYDMKKEKSIPKDQRKEERKCKNEIKSEKKDKYHVIAERKVKQTNVEKKRHKKETNQQLKVPQVQLQVSSEREIVDSIVVIKNKQEKKEEKLARKSKRRKEKKEVVITEQQQERQEKQAVNCSECQEERVRRRREREMRRSDELGNQKIIF